MSDVSEQILAELKLLNKKMDQFIIRAGAGSDLGPTNTPGMFPVNHVGPGTLPGMTGDPGAMAAMANAGRQNSIREEIEKQIAEAKRNAETERVRVENTAKQMTSDLMMHSDEQQLIK